MQAAPFRQAPFCPVFSVSCGFTLFLSGALVLGAGHPCRELLEQALGLLFLGAPSFRICSSIPAADTGSPRPH